MPPLIRASIPLSLSSSLSHNLKSHTQNSELSLFDAIVGITAQLVSSEFQFLDRIQVCLFYTFPTCIEFASHLLVIAMKLGFFCLFYFHILWYSGSN